MDYSKNIYDGNRAKEVLENEVFQWAITEIKREVTEQWQTSPARDVDGREKLWMMLQLANKLELILKTTQETGKLSEMEWTHKRNLAEKLKDAMYGGF